jgi:hypothetical protein
LFVHLGGNTLVRSKSIVALINIENEPEKISAAPFLKQLEPQGTLVKLENGSKSMIVTEDKVYLSPISTMTLKKRADFVDNLAAD